MVVIISILVYVNVFMISMLLFEKVLGNRSIERLNKYLSYQGYDMRTKSKLEQMDLKKKLNSISVISKEVEFFKKHRDKMDKRLENAGIVLTIEEVAIMFVVSIIFVGIAILIATGVMILAFISGVLTFVIGVILIKMKEKNRKEQIAKQLGDALDMMAGTLRAGYSFIQAIDTISKEMPMPISGEFKKTMKEMSIGVPVETALYNMQSRIYSEDLELFITSVIIQRQIGGNLSEILETIAATIRERIKIKGEVMVLTGQARISGLIVGLLPLGFAFVISLLNPEHLKPLVEDSFGLMMIGAGLTGQFIGFIIIKKIIDISY